MFATLRPWKKGREGGGKGAIEGQEASGVMPENQQLNGKELVRGTSVGGLWV